MLLHKCRQAAGRPVPWCVIDTATAATADLVRRLTESWGPGIASLAPRDAPDTDLGTPRAQAAAIQRRCAVRAWPGGAEGLDPFRVLEALRHGCLPLQGVPEERHAALAACLPDGLDAFTLALPQKGRLSPLGSDEWAERIDRGLSVILAGNLERDLMRALERLSASPLAAKPAA